MVPVTTVYDPQRKKYFPEGLHILIDCCCAALEVYGKRKDTNYQFHELGSKAAFCQEFEDDKNWKVFTISFVAYIFTKKKQGGRNKYFRAKVFCAPNWELDKFIFHVLEIDLIKYADPRFHHISLPIKEPPVRPLSFITTISLSALTEYNKSRGSDYRLNDSEMHPSSPVLLYGGGNADSYLYTISFHAHLTPSVLETFIVKALFHDDSLVAFLDIKIVEVAGSVGVEIE